MALQLPVLPHMPKAKLLPQVENILMQKDKVLMLQKLLHTQKALTQRPTILRHMPREPIPLLLDLVHTPKAAVQNLAANRRMPKVVLHSRLVNIPTLRDTKLMPTLMAATQKELL